MHMFFKQSCQIVRVQIKVRGQLADGRIITKVLRQIRDDIIDFLLGSGDRQSFLVNESFLFYHNCMNNIKQFQ